MPSRTTFVVTLGLLVTALVSLVEARPRPSGAGRAPNAYMLRLEGHLGPPRKGEKGTTDLRLNHRGKDYRFQLTRLRVLTGSRPPSRVLADVQPYRTNFLLQGAAAMVQRLDTATPGDRIEITAYHRAGSRDLLVSEITVSPPPTAPPKSTP